MLAETKGNVSRFLKVFDSVRLGTLLDLVPLLVAAGVVRSKGQAQSDEEVLAAGESILRWLARAGGAFRVGAAVYQVDARRGFRPVLKAFWWIWGCFQLVLGRFRPFADRKGSKRAGFRSFLKLMEQVQAMGLDQLSIPGLMKALEA